MAGPMHQYLFCIPNVGTVCVGVYVYVCRCLFDTYILCTILRHNDISPQAKSGKVKGYEEDPELTAQLHQTLADLEAGLAGEEGMPRWYPPKILNWIYIFSLRHPGSTHVHA